MPTPSRLHVLPFRVFAPLLLALAGCHYDYHCRCDDAAHGRMPQSANGQEPRPMAQPTTVGMPVPDSDGPQQPPRQEREVADSERERADRDAADHARREGEEREQQQRDEERATTERVHREMHERLDRLTERIARLERILLMMSRRMQDAERGR